MTSPAQRGLAILFAFGCVLQLACGGGGGGSTPPTPPPGPSLTSVAPDHGPEGTAVTLTGAHFTGTTSVRFNGASAAFTVLDDAHLTTVVPAGATTGPVLVTTPAGSIQSSLAFTISAASPSLSGFSPASGSVGATVTLSGAHLTGTTSVAFNGTAATFTVSSDAQVQATVPFGATSGPITLTAPGGTLTSPTSFTVTALPPQLSAFAPSSGAAGTPVVLTGSGLSNAASVTFNGTAASFTVVSDTQIQTSVPAGATTGPIQVATAAGSVPSPTAFTVLAGMTVPQALLNGDFERGQSIWVPAGTITDVTKVAGTQPTTHGGKFLAWMGGYGTPTSDILSQDFHLPAMATEATLRFWLRITTDETGTTPNDTFQVQLQDTQGAQLPAGLLRTFTNLDQGDWRQIQVDLLPFKGQNVRLFFKSIENQGLQTSFFVDDVSVSLTAPDLSPQLDTPSPASGYPGETSFTLTGRNLFGITGLTFNGTAGTWTSQSPLALTTQVPATATPGPVQLQTDHGVATVPFSVLLRTPEIQALAPSSGPVGTPLVILGRYLQTTTSLTLNGQSLPFTLVDAHQITATVPAGAASGSVALHGPWGDVQAGSFTLNALLPTLDLFVDRVLLTQGSQRTSGDVPLVKDRTAFLRVFVLANAVNTANPRVRVRIFNGASLVQELFPTGPTGGVPTRFDEGNLATSWNATLPPSLLQPGYSLAVHVDDTGAIPEADEGNNAWPAAGSATLDIRDTHPFKVTFIPVVQANTQGPLTGDVNASNTATFTDFLRRIHPVPDALDVQVHAPYTTQKVPGKNTSTTYDQDWYDLYSEIGALRTAESVTDRYYYGTFKPSYNFGGTGLGAIGGAFALGVDWSTAISGGTSTWRAGTFAHELGHNFNRRHAPCGGPAGVDPAYPYAGADIGAFGYDVFNGRLFAPFLAPTPNTDVMAYCGYDWISDYTYQGVLTWRQNGFGGAAAGLRVGAPPTKAPCLVVWGTWKDGAVAFEPPFQAEALPTSEDEDSPYTLDLQDASGQVLHSLRLALHEVDHGEGSAHTFAAAVPLRDLDAARLAALCLRRRGAWIGESRLAEPESGAAALAIAPQARRLDRERVEILWDARRHPLLVVRDERGDILTLARGGQAVVHTRAPRLDLELNQGLQRQRQRVELQP